ncbi:lysozyme inhibitor LprI family protein [Aquipseudomonas campi]
MPRHLFPLFLLLLWCPQGLAEDCESGAANMAEVRACLDRQNENEVQSAYSALLSKVKVHAPESASALETAQASWQQFAGDSCNFYSAFNAEDSNPADLQVNCWADFSKARVKVLNAWERQLDKRQQ